MSAAYGQGLCGHLHDALRSKLWIAVLVSLSYLFFPTEKPSYFGAISSSCEDLQLFPHCLCLLLITTLTCHLDKCQYDYTPATSKTSIV